MNTDKGRAKRRMKDCISFLPNSFCLTHLLSFFFISVYLCSSVDYLS